MLLVGIQDQVLIADQLGDTIGVVLGHERYIYGPGLQPREEITERRAGRCVVTASWTEFAPCPSPRGSGMAHCLNCVGETETRAKVLLSQQTHLARRDPVGEEAWEGQHWTGCRGW